MGSVVHTLVDADRASYETSSTKGRRLFVKVWYPTDQRSGPVQQPRESMWQDLYGAADVPRSLRYLTAYLTSVKTNTVRLAPMADAVANPRLLVYNHGMISVASENTLLMEHLASHGFVVLSIRHLDQLTEFHALNGALPEAERDRNRALVKRLAATSERDERARRSLEYYRSSSTTNRIVSARALDTVYVIDAIPKVMAWIPSSGAVDPSSDRVGLMGLSLGGAVATEVGRSDGRCSAVVNIDGGLFGTQSDSSVRVPYLMIYSEQNEGSNDLLLRNDGAKVHEVAIPRTKHLDFHDATMVLPVLRWIGVLGKAKPRETVDDKNQSVRKHLATCLGLAGGPKTGES